MSRPAISSAVSTQLNSLVRWPYGFLSQSGAAVNGLYLGALDQSTQASYSQYALWESIDASGVKQNVRLQATPSNELQLTNTSGSQAFGISGPAGSLQLLSFDKLGAKRASWYVDGSKEWGDNSGSDLYLGLYDDAGRFLQNSVKIARKSGEWLFFQIPSFSGIKTKPLTTADLPSCLMTNEGLRMAVTDAFDPAFLKPLKGGGNVHSPAYCDGTRWVAG